MAFAFKTIDVTIASGAATSGAVDLSDLALCGVILPATFDGTTLGFTVATTADGTYYTLRNASTGTDVAFTATASKYMALDPALFAGVRYVKAVASGNQSTTDTVLVFCCRPL